MIIVVNYDAGNLYSVSRALEFLGVPHSVTSDRKKIEQADGLILPGVGSASRAMSSLDQKGLLSVLKSYERPFLGICLGLQVLFSQSEEFGKVPGLGIIPGAGGTSELWSTIGVAQALGETAPLLLIGMVGYIATNYPDGLVSGFMSPNSAMPAQIYEWAKRADPAYYERAWGGIIILLVFLLIMNVIAIVLRRKFERRW